MENDKLNILEEVRQMFHDYKNFTNEQKYMAVGAYIEKALKAEVKKE